MAIIPFGEWLPDQADLNNPGVLKALNVIPRVNSYGPFAGLTVQSTNALTNDCLGAFSAQDDDGNIYVYAGDSSKLYEMSASLAWTDESKAGGYTAGADPVWEFALFDNKVIATNFTEDVQAITVGGGGAGAFADLITSTGKPKAKRVGVVRDFVVLGDINDPTDGTKANRIHWSGFGDSADFDADSATQSDFEDLKFGGRVTKVIGGVEYGVVFQSRNIKRMTYVGSPAIFDIDAVDRQRGCPYPNGIADYGRLVFYPSEQGFYVFDGTTSHEIGESRIDRSWIDQFDPADRKNLSAAIDPKNKLYMIAFPGTGNVGGAPNKIFMYYWPAGKWSEAEIDTQKIFSSQQQGFTLDTLDTVSTNIDTGFTESFDSDVWKGGRARIAAIDTDKKLSFFVGANLKATIGLPEIRMVEDGVSFLTGLRPLVDGTTAVTARMGTREKQGDAATFTSTISMNSDGEIPLTSGGRYQRAEIFVAAGETWTHAIGLDIPDDVVKPLGRNA